MEKGIRGDFCPYTHSQEKGYSFKIQLESNVSVEGSGYGSPEERNSEALRISKELGIILVNGI